MGIEWRSTEGKPIQRIYDWIFELKPEFVKRAIGLRTLLALGLIIFSLGANASLWMRDLSIRPFAETRIPLFAPDLKDQSWKPLPFFYATGAFPFGEDKEVEFGLPYERGPPNRFVGKITAYWRGLDSKLTLTGPLTLAEPDTQSELSKCFLKWAGCMSARRKLIKAVFDPFFHAREIEKLEWFRVENDFLPPDEQAQGIYLRSKAEKGRIREGYFLVGPKMAVQGFVLDRPDREEGITASKTLNQMIGSMRLTGDLAAPRAFLNPRLAGLRLTPKSTLPEMIAAEGHLLAKVSIEPKEAESYYHLGGLGITLYRRAKAEGRIELAASSKTIVKASLQFLKDIDPESKRVPEMEAFGAEVSR